MEAFSGKVVGSALKLVSMLFWNFWLKRIEALSGKIVSLVLKLFLELILDF